MAERERLILRLAQVIKHKLINTSNKAMLKRTWSFQDNCLHFKINNHKTTTSGLILRV